MQILPTDQTLTPPATGNKDQLEYIFDEWVHLQLPDTPKKTIAAFIYQLHQLKVMQTQADSIEFIRTCLDAAAASYEREAYAPYGNPDTATVKVDALGKLLVSLVLYQGEQEGQARKGKGQYFDSVLTVVILVFCNHQKARGDGVNLKVFFRLLSTILFELNRAVKENSFVGSAADVYLALAKAFLTLQPRNFPAFAFSWLALVAHRIFIPAMLEDNIHENEAKDKKWDAYAQLVETLLNYTGQLIKPTGETIISQNFYRGVLRVLLVIHHDYPEFLAENHFRFCNSIPMHCTQLRNLIVSAYPSVILEMPDPFSAGLKVDRVEDIRQPPIIRANIAKILTDAGIKDTLDTLLSASEQKSEDVEKLCNATYFAQAKPAGFELVPTTTDPVLIHAIVLYIGNEAVVSQGSKGLTFNPASPTSTLLETLAKELRPEAKFHLISAIANQLRWPNAHTHYFSYALLHLFGPPSDDPRALDVQQVITRVLLERLLVHRPHPWGLIITLLEILKGRTYAFWDLPFVKAAPEVSMLVAKRIRINID
jgi:CCR4-NOT transcription complex subunit 1